jgi:hypothetical protein
MALDRPRRCPDRRQNDPASASGVEGCQRPQRRKIFSITAPCDVPDLAARIERRAAALPNLVLAGNVYHGGELAAEQILALDSNSL